MIATTEQQIYTPEQYLELEAKAEQKHEYRDGEMVSMAGATTNHNRIVIDFCTDLNLALKNQDAELFAGDVRVWIPRYRQYTYPDVMIVQGKPIYQSPGRTTIINPSVIVEVLSKSTSSYDRGDKFRYYRSIAEFREYILIAQYEMLVEQFVKGEDGGKWLLTEYEREDAILPLESVPFEISLGELYQRVNFDENEEDDNNLQ